MNQEKKKEEKKFLAGALNYNLIRQKLKVDH